MRPYASPPALLALWLCARAAQGLAQDAGGASAQKVDLSSEAAARALSGLPVATTLRKDAPLEPSERALSEDIPGLVRMHDASFGEKAAYQINRLIWRILKFWKRPPESRRVRYFYIGRSVDIAIHDDGSYELRDKRGLIVSIAAVHSYKEPSQGPTTAVNEEHLWNPESAPGTLSGAGIGVRDWESALQSIQAGREPPNAEVHTFLAATQPLREQLMRREARRTQAAADVRMEEVLRSIWQVPGPSDEKQHSTFRLWDECSDDETGAPARKRVEAFVRELAVRRGECPYSAADLARLNQKRRSKAPFSPCPTEPILAR